MQNSIASVFTIGAFSTITTFVPKIALVATTALPLAFVAAAGVYFVILNVLLLLTVPLFPPFFLCPCRFCKVGGVVRRL
jgi:hypothetical protein